MVALSNYAVKSSEPQDDPTVSILYAELRSRAAATADGGVSRALHNAFNLLARFLVLDIAVSTEVFLDEGDKLRVRLDVMRKRTVGHVRSPWLEHLLLLRPWSVV